MFVAGALLMTAGAGLYVFVGGSVAAVVFALGALAFASMQLMQAYDGDSLVLRRLRRIMSVADVMFIVSAVLMLEDAFQLLLPLFVKYFDNGYYAFPDFGNYPYMHSAVFGIKPDEGGEAPEVVGLKEAYDNMGLTFIDPDIEVEVNVPFEVKYGFVYNAGTTTFNGSIAVVSVNRMEQIKEFLAVDLNDVTLRPGYGYSDVISRCTITEDIEIGDKIKLYYRSNRGGDWLPVLFGTDFGVTGELYLTYPYFIREVTSFEYLPEENLIRIETLADLDWTFSSSYGGEVAGGNTFDDGIIEIDTTDLPSGEYTVRISSDKDSFALDVVL